ncbi:TetR/AcrR family transcriptional regulator [Saccharomonospora sp. NB11]|uniref:TetR/AcrR family transcriptional regulator n=1 Tax=Saccharomonospora sp. NB11 TaxID=1642298 RepID=UPI0018D00E67|nr:TetR family transcriptional regulator [Saccharomonospora sp. NB11]
MTTRRNQVLDAAIRVLGTRGTRQLTHRAVDAEARLPQGSTSNYFRNRDALVAGVLDRLVTQDEQAWGLFSADLANLTLTLDTFTDALVQFVDELAATARTATLARYAIFLEAAHHEHLRELIETRRLRLQAWGAPWLQRLGSPRPEHDFAALRSLLDGLLLHQCTQPSPDFDPSVPVRALLEGLSAHWNAA